jgi:hypothetical protein
MLKPGNTVIIRIIKTSCYCASLVVFFIASLILLPYELFFISAVIILVLIRSLEKNARKYSLRLNRGKYNVMGDTQL